MPAGTRRRKNLQSGRHPSLTPTPALMVNKTSALAKSGGMIPLAAANALTRPERAVQGQTADHRVFGQALRVRSTRSTTFGPTIDSLGTQTSAFSEHRKRARQAILEQTVILSLGCTIQMLGGEWYEDIIVETTRALCELGTLSTSCQN